MARGGYRPGAGRKPNPNKPKVVAVPKLKATSPLLPAEAKVPSAIDPRALAMMLPEIEEISKRYGRTGQDRSEKLNPFKFPEFPKKAIPQPAAKVVLMAQDGALVANNSFASDAWLAGGPIGQFADEGLLFLGYPYLAELAQRPEYRTMAETIADDSTRKWIEFDVTGDEKKLAAEKKKDPKGFDERMADPDQKKKRIAAAGKTDKVKALQDDQLRIEVRERFYDDVRNGLFFGRSHMYLDFGIDYDSQAEELAVPIGDGRDGVSKTKVARDSFKSIRVIEPVWTYPLMYNAVNPLRKDWYNPQVWYVMGQQIHGSRLLTSIPHPVPDLLKPAYAFGGVSLSQLAKPYVDIWLQTRQSIADLIHSFSVMVLMTDLSTMMQPGNAGALLARVAMFNMLRDNQGAFVVNKNTEDFKNVSASLAGLHELQAQAQEHMCSVCRIPLVKFTGISPSGLNASSEGEINVYDDTISASQNRNMRGPLTKVINFEQLSLWGEIDPEITFHFEKLREMTQAEKGTKEKDDADRNQKYVDMGAIAPAEVRKIIVDDPELPYTGLDPDDVPEPPAEEGLLGPGAGGAAKEFETEHDPNGGSETGEGGGANDADLPFGATDAESDWNESDHPRAPDGKFGSGGGGSKAGGSMPEIPDFLKKTKGSEEDLKTGGKQQLKMPQFGLTPTPWESHQAGRGLFVGSSGSLWKPKPRAPMPKSDADPEKPGSVVAFMPGDDHGITGLNGVAFEAWEPPDDWADVEGQAEIAEPPLPDLPKGMTMSTGCVVREPDGRVWLMRPKSGFGGYDQTFPKGGLEEGLSPQANAIKEVYEETGLKVKITGFAGDHEGDVTVSRFYFAERESGDPAGADWEAEGVILAPPDKLDGLLNRKRDKEIAAGLAAKEQKPLDPKTLKKVGGKMGSNEGGTFEDADGKQYYIKRPATKAHVENELAAARLYQLAGVNTLNYRPVEGGNHVATDLEKLDKKNVADLTPAERKEATKDFAVHAWLSNWDAAGIGGDNQGVLNGKVTTLDVGGSLRYRAQGSPKGNAFGSKVTEIDTMRDPAKSYDAGKLFGKMSDSDLKASISRVTSIPDAAIRETVGGDKDLADTLIARKQDLAKRFSIQAADEAPFEEGKHPRAPDGKFTSGGGGGSSTELSFKSKKEHAAHLLKNGTTTKQILKALGWPSISMPQMAKTLGMNLHKTKVNGESFYTGVPMTEAEKSAAKGKAAMAAAAKAESAKLAEYKGESPLASMAGKPAPKLGQTYGEWKAEQAPAFKPQAPKPKYGPATQAELVKAAKTIPLQIQYVPNAAGLQGNAEAQKLVAAFNDKWAGKPVAGAALQEKVDDFKDMNAAMVPLMNEAQKKQQEAAAAQMAKQAEENKAALAKLEASMSDPAVKKHFDALAKIANPASFAKQVPELEKFIAKHKLAIKPIDCAFIRAYVGNAYSGVNDQLRKGVLDVAQWKYAHALDDALGRMPKHEGYCQRGVSFPTAADAQKYYGSVGKVVDETQFNSAGVKKKLWGSHTMHIQSKTAADIQAFNPGEGGGEVVFRHNTKFVVTKANPKTQEIWMEEV